MVASPLLSALPGETWMHPGQLGQISVLRFTAPGSGGYDVSAGFYGIDAKPTSTGVHVLVNGVSVFDDVVSSYRGTPQTYSATVLLSGGDTVDIAVDWGPNNDWGWDSTGVTATIVSTPPPALLLLAGGLAGLTRIARARKGGRA